ncbi:hypothetical protein [Desulfosarcina variabilis]|uniref:hypothetical protein n=1 Tax=Desulfosarcina variabilis TaxID=2300 RepID=UPI003AFAC89C
MNSRNSELSTVNIVDGNMRFFSPTRIESGKIIALEMCPETPGRNIIATAKVVWCKSRPKKSRHLVNIEFLWIGWKDPSIQNAIAEFINESIEKIDGIACNCESYRSITGVMLALGYLSSFVFIGYLLFS